MLILPGTSDIVRVITGNAVATDVVVSYVDHTTTTYVPGRQLTAITTATTTTILSAPAASTQRSVKHMTICARGGAQTIVLQYFDGATAFQMVGGTTLSLAAGETLQYTDEDGFLVLPAASPNAGRLLRAPQYVTAGTSLVHPTGTNTIIVRGVGGGGASGGNDAVAGSAGANGGSGTYGERTFNVTSLTSTYTIGAGGTGVSGAAGNAGGSSTWTQGGVTMTLPGGNGGGFLAGAATIGSAAGGAVAAAATNADFSIQGQAGGDVLRPAASAAPMLHTGGGGDNPLGQGGSGNAAVVAASVAGNAGTGLGSGSSGVLNTVAAAAAAGTAGRAGGFIVEEYS